MQLGDKRSSKLGLSLPVPFLTIAVSLPCFHSLHLPKVGLFDNLKDGAHICGAAGLDQRFQIPRQELKHSIKEKMDGWKGDYYWVCLLSSIGFALRLILNSILVG